MYVETIVLLVKAPLGTTKAFSSDTCILNLLKFELL